MAVASSISYSPVEYFAFTIYSSYKWLYTFAIKLALSSLSILSDDEIRESFKISMMFLDIKMIILAGKYSFSIEVVLVVASLHLYGYDIYSLRVTKVDLILVRKTLQNFFLCVWKMNVLSVYIQALW